MNYVIASFRSRSDSIAYYKALLWSGISAEIINTPKEAKIGCGLSVRFQNKNLEVAKTVLKQRALVGFVGFFGVKNVGNKKIIFKL